jgi:pimeloyl-ACP methyl ester carboxylesterase
MPEPREFRLDIGEVELAGVEWPGTGDPVLLLHATGFHSRCWNQVVAQLPGRHVYAVDLRFHGNSGSIGDVDWNILTEDICILVETLDLQRAIGVGHSIGGYLIARAAAAHPGRFKQLLLIDPVITSPQIYEYAREMSTDLKAEDHPVSRRKNRWQDSDEMYRRFSEREPFSTWDKAVLRDYCDYALHPENEEGYRQLLCDPINEASVYVNQSMSNAVLEELHRLSMPVTLMRAFSSGPSISDLSTSPTWPELPALIPDCREIYLPQMNHFIPMQDPGLVATYIQEAVAA